MFAVLSCLAAPDQCASAGTGQAIYTKSICLYICLQLDDQNWHEGKCKEIHGEEDRAGEIGPPSNQSVDRGRWPRLEGPLQGAHACCENLKANEEDRWRVASPGRDSRNRIGRSIADAVKKSLGRGNFLPWIEAEFGMSEDSARRFMNACKQILHVCGICRRPPSTCLRR